MYMYMDIVNTNVLPYSIPLKVNFMVLGVEPHLTSMHFLSNSLLGLSSICLCKVLRALPYHP